MWALATGSGTSSSDAVQVVALVVGLVQTLALAVIADRSRRVRSTDRRHTRSTDRRGPLRSEGVPVREDRHPETREAPERAPGSRSGAVVPEQER
jgi:hypothetical protein